MKEVTEMAPGRKAGGIGANKKAPPLQRGPTPLGVKEGGRRQAGEGSDNSKQR
jgi:hypothetical protein